MSGGAALPVEVLRGLEEAFGVPVLEGYGLPETSPVASFNHPGRERKPGSIGTPIRDVRIRLTHRQAIAAQAVALAAGSPPPRVVTFGEVAPVAMMLGSADLLRAWVLATLAGLATDDERHARLRDTLLVFLQSGGSYKTTAEQMVLHTNTVQYRIRRAGLDAQPLAAPARPGLPGDQRRGGGTRGRRRARLAQRPADPVPGREPHRGHLPQQRPSGESRVGEGRHRHPQGEHRARRAGLRPGHVVFTAGAAHGRSRRAESRA